MTYQIKNEPEDITLQFYYKRATFISPYSGAKVDVHIKKVEHFADVYTFGKYQTVITSTQGIEYLKEELTNFTF